MHFYPRSPCGERQWIPSNSPTLCYFYPRSPCGERRCRPCTRYFDGFISIHALLAESDRRRGIRRYLGAGFLSTLSLRRATPAARRRKTTDMNFYPRSPCGERQANAVDQILPGHISIHALLAESDEPATRRHNKNNVFLSTLSLRRATLPSEN